MSTLFLVRHGQASFMADNYDQLSPIGYIQAQVLAEHWVALNMIFDKIFVGPKLRQKQTMEAVASVYQANNLPWPQPEFLSTWDEHQGFEVMWHMLPELAETDPIIKKLVPSRLDLTKLEPEVYLKILRHVLRLWVRGEIKTPSHEPWLDFKDRVEQGLQQIVTSAGRGKTLAAFTSAGPVAVGTGYALNAVDEKTLELAWAVRNATYTEFLFSQSHLSLSAFNVGSHFRQAELVTYV